MRVELVYALPSEQNIISLVVAEGTTVLIAIEQSGILKTHPEIDLNANKTGIFSRLVELSHVVREGDRVEIYRPLTIDPMEARRLRAPIRRKKHSSVKS